MPTWKKNIFIKAVKVIMEREGRDVNSILNDFSRLTEEEKQEIMTAVNHFSLCSV